MITRVPFDVTHGRAVTSPHRLRTHRLAVAVLALLGVIVVIAAIAVPLTRASRHPAAATRPRPRVSPVPQLPRGGHTIFPAFRVVAFKGVPGTGGRGLLGRSPADAVSKLATQAGPYAASRPVLPALEVVATAATGGSGADGLYRARTDPAKVQAYLEAARAAKMLLVLDIQPGRADFLREVEAWASYLREPDVGLALDPEYSVSLGQIPGTTFGSTDAGTINKVTKFLSTMVQRDHLPQKLLVIHRFTTGMIGDPSKIVARPGLATVVDVDGSGDGAAKTSKYELFAQGFQAGIEHGITLYPSSDPDLMQPPDVLHLAPPPSFVVYQ